MSLDLTLLNKAQKEAVINTEGPCLILAGPGSGKTRVLTHRVAYLIGEQAVFPYRIMVLTFTRKAAQAMKNKLIEMIGDQVNQLWIGTFHHVFGRILRREADVIGFAGNFSIYDREDSKTLLKRILKELRLNEKTYLPAAILKRIGQAKRHFFDAQTYQNQQEWKEEDSVRKMPHLHAIYAHYETRCKSANVMDYDDLLFRTYQLFHTQAAILEKYQRYFTYLLVDEFQDTDPLQYTILKQLTQNHHNLCVIGDDAQSIYAFRGADVHHMLAFQKDFPVSKVFRLEQNYRSTQQIVAAANTLIKYNTQHPKTLFTHNQQGFPIDLFTMLNDLEEAQFVAKRIAENSQNQLNYDHFVVLYRNNNQSRALEEALVRQNIPYQVIGSLSFYQRKEIKDLLAYLHLIVNPNNEEALQRAINFPKRNIGPVTLAKVRAHAQHQSCTVWEAIVNVQTWMKGQVAKNIDLFAQLIENHKKALSTHNGYEIAQKVAQESGLLKLLQEDDTITGANRYEHVQTFLDSMRLFCDQHGKEATLSRFLEDIALLTSGDEIDPDTKPKVKLMTVHKAKGLEFPYVYIIGMEEEVFPSHFSLDNAQAIEEERRLFFVAITRAQKKLVITHAEHRYYHGKIISSRPSRFLKELGLSIKVLQGSKKQKNRQGRKYAAHPSNPFVKPSADTHHVPLATLRSAKSKMTVADFQIGKMVLHPKFGKGTIKGLKQDGMYEKIVVDFFKAGQKTLLLSFARLTLL